jgi:7-carboxy-7-deazaguanine synthase
MNDPSAAMEEIFSSIQGEGMLVGLRQIFLRFCACNLDCAYCDTPRNHNPGYCMIEDSPGKRDIRKVENPVSLGRILALIDRWIAENPGLHHSISLTGGEPLLYADTLADWLPVLRGRLPVYLETNGVLDTALAHLIKNLDIISMDIKLPSTSGLEDMWAQHLKFLKIAAQISVYVKSVISEATEPWEIRKTAELIASVDRTIPFILQPVTLKNGAVGITPLKTLKLQECAGITLSEVRVIPQTHKYLGQL